MKNIFFLALLLCGFAFADTNTLTDRIDGETIGQAYFNDIHDALSGTIVPRNSSGAPTTGGGALGSATYRWGAIYGAAGDFSGVVQGPAGAVGAPTWSFSGDTDTGLWNISENVLGFAAASVQVGKVTGSDGDWYLGKTSVTSSTLRLYGSDLHLNEGGVAATRNAIYTGETAGSVEISGGNSYVTVNSGGIKLYGSTHATLASRIQFYSAGSVIGTMSATGFLPAMRIASDYGGDQNSPDYTWNGDADTGFYKIGANRIGVTTNGALNLDISEHSFVSSGTTTGSRSMYVENTNSGASAHAFMLALTTTNGDPYYRWSNGSVERTMGIDSSDSGTLKITNSGSGPSAGTTHFSITTAGLVTIGDGTSNINRINGATEAAAAGASTLLNAPTNAAGNPDIWAKISYNGTTYVFPLWTP